MVDGTYSKIFLNIFLTTKLVSIRASMFLIGVTSAFPQRYFHTHNYQGGQPVSYPLTSQYNNNPNGNILSQQFSKTYQDPRINNGVSEPQHLIYQMPFPTQMSPKSSIKNVFDPYHQPTKPPYQNIYVINGENYGVDFNEKHFNDGNTGNGQYSVLLPDGRVQNVKYVADPLYGYIADVSYHKDVITNNNFNAQKHANYQKGRINENFDINYNIGGSSESYDRNEMAPSKTQSQHFAKNNYEIYQEVFDQKSKNNIETPSQRDILNNGFNFNHKINANSEIYKEDDVLDEGSHNIPSLLKNKKSSQKAPTNQNIQIQIGVSKRRTLPNDRFPNFSDSSTEIFGKDANINEQYYNQRFSEYTKKSHDGSFNINQKENPKKKRESFYIADDEKEHAIYETSTSKSVVSSKITISEQITVYSG